ncbi:hypothetical protein E2C01_099193 [Portunus trituberculatus]|uniref:Uncharacterized protein n=1 Tax=Portunus trituberculatus TaxID=210409 RepID=A0A5B7JZP4_PORTR|nr:hypothetical protein [Portunus trituberculatus]
MWEKLQRELILGVFEIFIGEVVVGRGRGREKREGREKKEEEEIDGYGNKGDHAERGRET